MSSNCWQHWGAFPCIERNGAVTKLIMYRELILLTVYLAETQTTDLDMFLSVRIKLCHCLLPRKSC